MAAKKSGRKKRPGNLIRLAVLTTRSAKWENSVFSNGGKLQKRQKRKTFAQTGKIPWGEKRILKVPRKTNQDRIVGGQFRQSVRAKGQENREEQCPGADGDGGTKIHAFTSGGGTKAPIGGNRTLSTRMNRKKVIRSACLSYLEKNLKDGSERRIPP